MLLDLILILLVAFGLYRGWKRGFVYTIGLFLVLGLAFIMASNFSGGLAKFISAKSGNSAWMRSLQQQVAQVPASTEAVAKWDALALPAAFESVLTDKLAGFAGKDIKTVLAEAGAQGKAVLDKTMETMAQGLLLLFLQAICFLLIFLLTFFCLRLILRLLSKVIHALPLIGLANSLLGLVLGGITALLLTALIFSLIPSLVSYWPNLALQQKQSVLAPFVFNSSLYASLLDIIF